MTLPVSPNTITAADINVELGRSSTDPFDINGVDERALAGVASGPISFSDFHGKSASPVCTYGDLDLSIVDVLSDSFHGYIEAGFSYDFSDNNRYFGTGTNTVIHGVGLFGLLINDQSGGTFRLLLKHDATIGAIPQDFFDSLVVQGVGTLTSASATYTASLGTTGYDTTEWKWVTGITIAAAGFTDGATRTINVVDAVTNLTTCYP